MNFQLPENTGEFMTGLAGFSFLIKARFNEFANNNNDDNNNNNNNNVLFYFVVVNFTGEKNA
jgi:hypothetical protein